MPTTQTFDEQMVAKIQAVLLANPGATVCTYDGQQTTYADLEKRLQFFERRVAMASSTNPRSPILGVNFSGGTL